MVNLWTFDGEPNTSKLLEATDFDQHDKRIWSYFSDSLKHKDQSLDKHMFFLSIQIMVRENI